MTRRRTPEVIGDADERHPGDPVVPLPAPRPGVLDDLAGSSDRPSLPMRILRGDWRASAFAALPAVVVTVLAAAAASVSVLVATRPNGDELLVQGTGLGRWLRYVAVAVGMAFGSPVSAETKGDEAGDFGPGFGSMSVTFVPLTVTLIGLAVLWLLVRRTTRDATDRVADAARTGALFAAGVAAVAAFGRWSVPPPGYTQYKDIVFEGMPRPPETTFSVSAPQVLVWAFLAAFGVALLAHRARAAAHPWSDWGLPVRGAAVGLATGIGSSFVLAIALGYGYASRVDAASSDVTRALPAFVGYAVNLGTAAFGFAAGGSVTVPSEEPTTSMFSSFMPGEFLLVLVVPLVAVLAASWYVTTRGRRTPAEAATACARMAVPAALVWWVLAVIGNARQSYDGFGGARFGAVLWGALLVGLWFGVVGWLAGRVLGRELAPAAFDPPEPAPVP